MRMPATQTEFVSFDGGLDQVTPPLLMPPGRCRTAQNFELDTQGGYVRSLGYERYDGRASPSDADYKYIPATVTGAVTNGATVTGATSGATGVVIASGLDRVIVTKVTGTFVSAENLTISAVVVAVTTAAAYTAGGDSQDQIAQYKNLAADVYRADITAVPGTGEILGIKYFGGSLYAIRNNAGGTAADWYKSSGTGWTAVTFGEEVAFTNANTGVGEGDTLTKGGVTATISRVVVQTGSLGSGVNTGRLIITGRSGGNFSAGAATTTGAGALTLSGAQSAITFLPDGRFSFKAYNFGAGERLYGCDGVNRAFEFSGTVMVPIATGMTADTPLHIAAHKGHLFLSFANSMQHSSIGDPYSWSVVTGAAELNLGSPVTAMMPMPGDNVAGGAMACFTTSQTYLLYGTSSADWELVTQRSDIGALAYTAQFIDTAYYMDLRGVTSLNQSANFGNFEASTLSGLVRPFVTENKSRIKDSCIVKDKNQYRIMFSGGVLLVMTLRDNGVAGFMPISLAHSMVLMEQSDSSAGEEVVFYADEDGMVYQAEKGTSFDGDAIESFMLLGFNSSKSPRVLKQYRKVVFEIGALGYAQFYHSAELDYGNTDLGSIDAEIVGFNTNAPGGGSWDTGVWDVGNWDGSTLLPAEISITGLAQNISIRITQFSDYHQPLTFYGGLMHYTPRRQMR